MLLLNINVNQYWESPSMKILTLTKFGGCDNVPEVGQNWISTHKREEVGTSGTKSVPLPTSVRRRGGRRIRNARKLGQTFVNFIRLDKVQIRPLKMPPSYTQLPMIS